MKLSKDLAKKALANNLQKCLKEKGLRQNKFAASVGMSAQQFSFYILGKREANEENLIKIARGLNLSNHWELLRMADGMAPEPLMIAWNALIDLQALSPKDVAKASEYINLLIESRKLKKESPPEK